MFLHFLPAVDLVGVAIHAEKVLVGCEEVEVVVDELIDDCVDGVLFVFYLFVEIVVDVLLVGQRLSQVVVVPLSLERMVTLDRSR